MQLPRGIDPHTPVGQLTDEELARLAASVQAQRKWAKVTPAARSRAGKRAARGRMERMTAAERQAVASRAGQASAEARRRKREAGESQPPTPLS